MSAPEAEIRRLMARGLDLYGLGQVREATECWRRVLALDPDHAEARDFLQTAVGEPEQPAPAAGDAVLLEAVGLLRRGALAEGLDLLETLAGQQPARLDVQAFVELARGALLRVYRQNVGNGGRVPRVRIPPDQVMKYNLPASAGFLLSLIDGRTSVDELPRRLGHGPVRRAARREQPARRGHRGDRRVNRAERSLLSFLDAPVVVGDPEGRAVYVNPAFEARFGQGGRRGRRPPARRALRGRRPRGGAARRGRGVRARRERALPAARARRRLPGGGVADRGRRGARSAS